MRASHRSRIQDQYRVEARPKLRTPIAAPPWQLIGAFRMHGELLVDGCFPTSGKTVRLATLQVS